jgi:hypothetical protein
MLARLLYHYTANRRCRLIPRKPGQPYLERYWLFSLFGVTAYLHRFVAADIDEGPHDHPWSHAIAWVLAGGYIEERGHIHPHKGFDGTNRVISRWAINHLRGHDFHRIKTARPETWTLFIHRPKTQPWGFIATINGEAIYHQPFTDDTTGWHKKAPLGKHAGREPFNG